MKARLEIETGFIYLTSHRTLSINFPKIPTIEDTDNTWILHDPGNISNPIIKELIRLSFYLTTIVSCQRANYNPKCPIFLGGVIRGCRMFYFTL